MAGLAEEISTEGAVTPAPSHSNLFVGNIDAAVTEDTLKTAFAPFGEIASVLLSNKAGRPSAFVKMADTESASRAAAGLNGNQGWEVKSANYDVGAAPKWNSKGKGFGGGYGYGYGGGYGGGYPKGYSKGFSYGGWTYVGGGGGGGKGGYGGGYGYGKGSAVPELRDDGPEKPEPPQCDNLYVKHLHIGSTEETVRATFSECGEVAEVRILRPDFALECAALVRFEKQEDAEKARTTLDGTVVKGETAPLYANTQTKSGASKKDHVYIKNIPTNTQEDKIKAIIGAHGEIQWHKIMRANAGSRIGATCAALFEMSSEDEAEACITALNEKAISLSELCGPMKVRYAENKAKKAEASAATEETLG